MNDHVRGGRIKRSLLGNRYAYIGVSMLSFTLTALAVYFLSKAFEATDWFSIILGVTTGMIAFCCVRVWMDEDEFDAPDTKSYIILTGTLTFVAMIMTYITMNIYPFGDHTVLIIDMHHQYVAFFSLLRDKLTSGGSLLYSDSLGLGGGFLPLFAYYLSSPFNIIMLLFPRHNLTEAIALVEILKITAGGVTFAIAARKLTGRNNFMIVAGGVMYSLMSFYVCHAWNVMWLDPLWLLPLTFLGLKLLLDEGKPLLYCLSLAMTLITSYYIGYMICIYLVLCFFAIVISDTRVKDLTERVRRFWRFCYGSLIGGGLSAAIIIPAFIYLQQTSGAEDQFARELAENFNLFALIQRMLLGAYPSMRGDNLPNIYCTILAMYCFVLFLLCKSIPLRQRIAWAGVAGAVAVGMAINWTNFAWHGFHFPNDLPFRFSFLLSFTMVIIAIQLLGNIEKLRSTEVVSAAGIVAALILIEQQFGDGKATFVMIYGSLAFLIVYALLLALKTTNKLKSGLCFALLLLFVFSEATANASLLLKQLDENEYYTERQDFVFDYDVDRLTFDAIDEYDQPMYREELLPRKTCNDPSLFDYSGLTVFASSNRKSVTTLMGKLGYAVNGVNSYLYKNYVPVSDSLLGLKYVALNKEIGGHAQLVPIKTVETSDEVDGITQEYTRYIHENTTALPKAFMVNKGIIGWEWDNANPFAVQNSLLTHASGVDSVFSQIYFHEAGESYDPMDEDNFDYYDEDEGYEGDTEQTDSDEIPVTPTNGGQEPVDIQEFNCTVDINGTYFGCSKISDDLNADFTITQVIEEAGQYYAYIDCRAAKVISVGTTPADSDSETNINSSPNEANILDLGWLDAGAKVAVKINSEISCGGNIFMAYLNTDVFNDAIDRLDDSVLNVTSYDEGRIEGTVTNDESGMMFTSIPHDAGWTVKVDGKRVSTFALGDALLCFAVPAGEHAVTMSYFPSGLVAGIIISLLFAFILVALVNKKLRAYFEGLYRRFILSRIKPKMNNHSFVASDVELEDDFDTPAEVDASVDENADEAVGTADSVTDSTPTE